MPSIEFSTWGKRDTVLPYELLSRKDKRLHTGHFKGDVCFKKGCTGSVYRFSRGRGIFLPKPEDRVGAGQIVYGWVFCEISKECYVRCWGYSRQREDLVYLRNSKDTSLAGTKISREQMASL